MLEISVIVPVYNTERYLSSCINSILEQSFSDIELILIDDGSKDSSGVICDQYAELDSRIRVIHQENAGVSVARNRGIEEARGKYICFIDSDDIVNCEYCSTLHKLLKDTTCDFSVCAVRRFRDGEEHDTGKENSKEFKPHTIKNVEYLKRQLDKKNEIGPIDKLFRREALERIRFKDNRRYEDVTFSADLALHLHNGIVYTDQILYYYRQQDSGFMATQAVERMADFVQAGEHMICVSEAVCPSLRDACLRYAAEYPFMFVDGIYVRREFKQNRAFLDALQALLRKYQKEYAALSSLTSIQRKRMQLFARSRFLYGFNAYARLLRVYLYRILGKDAYADGHGI